MKPILIGILLFHFIIVQCYGQPSSEKEEYTFMFYNTENMFDYSNDSVKLDDEFTPEGTRRWTNSRLYGKANRIAKVIIAAGKWNAPALVGLCEIEDREVLERLVGQTSLAKYRYKIIHKDSPDERGIDVALIYRPELFKPFDYKAITLIDPGHPTFKTRDILQISGVLNNWDTIHLFVNHWPSRFGGIMETVGFRNLAAEVLKKSIQEIFAIYPKAKIICMGDFNDSPEDESLSRTLNAVKENNAALQGEMVNLSANWITLPVQTLKNWYTWQVFDQWIVSDYMIENKVGMNLIAAEIFAPTFLLETDTKYGGVKPKRTYIGFKYQEGFSDHLPILLKFRMSN